MTTALTQTDELRKQLEAVLDGPAKEEIIDRWQKRLQKFLDEVDQRRLNATLDGAFLMRLWDDNPVASTGSGSVKIRPALADEAFSSWFVQVVLDSTLNAEDVAQVEAPLTELYDALETKLGPLCGRTPTLKINRVMCVLFPDHFTTIAAVGRLLDLHKMMGGSRKDHPVHAHMSIRRRIDEALGATPPADPMARTQRMCLPWLLYARMTAGTASQPAEPLAPEVEDVQHGLQPLAASLRRKGLTSLRGSFQALLSFLPDLEEGLTREEFSDLIRKSNPDLADSSIGAAIHVVSREFDLCRCKADVYHLTDRGIALRHTQDPHELADLLLTRVLGVDHVLLAVASEPRSKSALTALLQEVNPGWTTNFIPSCLVGWMVSLGLIKPNASRQYELLALGQQWCDLVTWTPEFLPLPVEAVQAPKQAVYEKTQLPDWATLNNQLRTLVAGKLALDERAVQQLHAGLWSHPVRHFAVLTGISGSGKTQLALNYALALCGEQTEGQESVKVIPVQPGWFDPSPLLGYVNPIAASAYRSAAFLELLLRASQRPQQPFVAVLDEMNLSHPEQYLAPILSTMETLGQIDLHALADGSTEIPKSLRYPSNLAIIGTLNMDETTHGLSDKVLDRAFTLEFWDIDVLAFPGWQTTLLQPDWTTQAQAVLQGLGQALAPVRLHFGWRTVDDVLAYLHFAAEMGVERVAALDDVVYAKVLPKLRGERSQAFETALNACFTLMQTHGLTRCAVKLKSMQTELGQTNMARFWR